jgi:predicted acyltransferase
MGVPELSHHEEERSGAHATAPPQKSVRLASIDALRGFDLFWIIGGGPMVMNFCKLFANPLPPALERQFDHVRWEGFVAWDLIMPLFLFIVGAAMPFSIGKRIERGDGRWLIYRKVIYRVAVLWILGIVAQGNLLLFKMDELQLYSNTLQAIAAGYLISAIALVEMPPRWHKWLAAALLLAYWAVLRFVPAPGHDAGDFSPDGNIALWLDKKLLGHFQDGSHYTWIMSSLGFGATVLMGAMAGNLLRGTKDPSRKILLLTAYGAGCLMAGRLWSFELPIIKHIWTSSMVLWSSGWCLLLLALFYWLVDVRGYKRWAFIFVVLGANSILAYMIPETIAAYAFPDISDPQQIAPKSLGGMAEHPSALPIFLFFAGALVVQWLAMYFLYRKRIFVRI